MPENILISTKVVGNDWNYRQSDHFLIGNVADRPQVVEMNLFGTWQREHYVANAYTDEIRRRFDHWEEKGVYGIFVPPDGRTRLSRPIGNAQEANLWVIGRLAAGERDVDAIWRDFSVRRFGEQAADAMVRALRPTGAVLDESLHVGREFFGHPENGIPCFREMVGKKASVISDQEAEEVPEDLEKHTFAKIPFTINFSTWRWDPSYTATYHRIRKGHADIIADKVRAALEQLASAQRSLALIDTVKDTLPPGGYAYTRFKLEENIWHLRVMTEMELAWLKASNALYYCGTDEARAARIREVEGHLAALEALHAEAQGESIDVQWQGLDYHFDRGQYLSILGFVDEFREYWGLETGRRHLPKTESDLDTPYGTIRIYAVGDTTYYDWGPAAKAWDLSDRHIIWTIKRLLTPPDQPNIIGG